MNTYICRGIASLNQTKWDPSSVDNKALMTAKVIKKEFYYRIAERKEREKEIAKKKKKNVKKTRK